MNYTTGYRTLILFAALCLSMMGITYAQTCDGVLLEPGEECELGDLGCGTDCFYEQPECTLTVNGSSAATVDLGSLVTFTSTVVSGSANSPLNFGNGYDTVWSGSVQYTYPTLGTYVASYSVENPGYPNLNTTCSATITIQEPLCGNGIADAGEECGDPGTAGCSGGDLCLAASCTCQSICPSTDGDPINFFVSPINFGDGRDGVIAENVDHTYQYASDTAYTAGFRVVNTSNTGLQAICEVDIDVVANSCGNGTVDAGEECGEPGHNTCTAEQICNPYSCLCNNSCEEVTIVVEEECDDGMYCSDGTACSYSAECVGIGDEFCAVRSGDGCSNTCDDEYCGDGNADLNGFDNILGNADDEECDDGNSVNDDACTNRCTFPTCGDGILDTDGFDDIIGTDDDEVCDNGSFCYVGGVFTNCTLDPTICDAGANNSCEPRNTETCSATCDNVERCGDAILQVGEECDDGNLVNNDACDNACELTYCGDGIAQNPNGIGFTSGLDLAGDPVDGQWQNPFGEQCDEQYCSDGTVCTQDSDCGGALGPCQRRPGFECSSTCQRQQLDAFGTCGGKAQYYSGVHNDFINTITSEGDLCGTGIPVQVPVGTVTPKTADAQEYVTVTAGSTTLQIYDDGHTWHWMCEGNENGTLNAIECQTRECGDGVLHFSELASIQGETCDDGNKVNGDGCDEFCQMEEVLQSEFGASCIDNSEPDGLKNGVLPVVHSDEFLPVRWELDTPADDVTGSIVDWESQSCGELQASGTTQGVLGRQMLCRFQLWNTEGFVTEDVAPCYRGINSRPGNSSNTITLAIEDGGGVMEDVLMDYGYNPGVERGNILGVDFIDLGETLDQESVVYGQYKLFLESIEYDYCAPSIDISKPYIIGGEENTPPPIVNNMKHTYTTPEDITVDMKVKDYAICEMKVSVAQGYLTQKGAVLQEIENTELSNFVSFDNIQFTAEGTPLSAADVNLVQLAESNEGKDWLFNGFIEEFEDKAVVEKTGVAYGGHSGWNNSTTLAKVPNDTIIFYKNSGNIDEVSINSVVIGNILNEFNIAVSEPFTLVFENEDITVNIDSDLAFNGSYIVNGDISFNPVECDDYNVVEGIFITNGMFQANEIRNDDLGATERCSKGSLSIDGILIGDGITTAFADKRRATLSSWNTSEDGGYLFSDSYPGQAKQLFDVCYLPNLLEYKLNADASGALVSDPNFAKPVSLTPDGLHDTTILTNPLYLCTAATFQWGKDWIIEECTAPNACNVKPVDIKNEILANSPLPVSKDTFTEYAQGRINYWIKEYMTGNLNGVVADLGIDPFSYTEIDLNGDGDLDPLPSYVTSEFRCTEGSQDEPGCEWRYFRQSPETPDIVEALVYVPAWLQARQALVDVAFNDLRSSFVGFDKIVTNVYGNTNESGIPYPDGIYGKIWLFWEHTSGYYSNFDTAFFPIVGLNNSISSVLSYVDFNWLSILKPQISQQNTSKSNELFKGSSVLLQLNASKRTTLSPGLKSYLDETIVEK